MLDFKHVRIVKLLPSDNKFDDGNPRDKCISTQ